MWGSPQTLRLAAAAAGRLQSQGRSPAGHRNRTTMMLGRPFSLRRRDRVAGYPAGKRSVLRVTRRPARQLRDVQRQPAGNDLELVFNSSHEVFAELAHPLRLKGDAGGLQAPRRATARGLGYLRGEVPRRCEAQPRRCPPDSGAEARRAAGRRRVTEALGDAVLRCRQAPRKVRTLLCAPFVKVGVWSGCSRLLPRRSKSTSSPAGVRMRSQPASRTPGSCH